MTNNGQIGRTYMDRREGTLLLNEQMRTLNSELCVACRDPKHQRVLRSASASGPFEGEHQSPSTCAKRGIQLQIGQFGVGSAEVHDYLVVSQLLVEA